MNLMGYFIYFILLCRCDAPVGRLGGRQTLVLGPGCEYLGNILHELGHAIGLDDQHKRSDRDNYITINQSNIKEGYYYYLYN